MRSSTSGEGFSNERTAVSAEPGGSMQKAPCGQLVGRRREELRVAEKSATMVVTLIGARTWLLAAKAETGSRKANLGRRAATMDE